MPRTFTLAVHSKVTDIVDYLIKYIMKNKFQTLTKRTTASSKNYILTNKFRFVEHSRYAPPHNKFEWQTNTRFYVEVSMEFELNQVDSLSLR